MISGRAQPGEYAEYAQSDIDFVKGDDIVAILESQITDTVALLRSIKDADFTYAPGKWTLRQVVHHMSDDERIFAYRCLCLMRNDPRPLAGFDEKLYAEFADSGQRPMPPLIDELLIVRSATLALLRDISEEAWMRRGIVNGYGATVRGLAFHIVGHELHHLRIIREKYLR